MWFIPNESLYFWRTTSGAEVDFVVKHENRLIPVEVKSTEMKKPVISRSLRSFNESFKPATAIVVNRGLSQDITINGTKILFIPAYAL